VNMSIRDEIIRMVQKALLAHASGERVAYEVGTQLMPTAPQHAEVMVHIILTMPSFVLGQRCQSVVLLRSVHPSEKEIDDMVVKMVAELRKRRSQDLAGGNGQPQEPTWDDMEARGSWDQALGED